MNQPKIGLVWYGDQEERNTADLGSSRFALAAKALSDAGLEPVAVVYNDEFAEEARGQMLSLEAVQVWVNPISGGKDRTILDSILRDVAKSGTLVFTHPDTIMRLGTKRVLFDLRDTSIGSEVYEHQSLGSLKQGLATRLESGPKVIKQFRGHSGGGIWKFTAHDSEHVLLRHAERGCPEELLTFDDAVGRMRLYFESGHSMFEQPYQQRIGEGMVRIYLVGRQVAGFGFQEAVALAPANPDGTLPEMGPRPYFPPYEPQFQHLRKETESNWIDEITQALKLSDSELPLLWDIDLMFGPRDDNGDDTYVLCEINVSCVSPYPEWANPLLATEVLTRMREKTQ
jgi:hypothetical protein